MVARVRLRGALEPHDQPRHRVHRAGAPRARVEGTPRLRDFQVDYARSETEVAAWGPGANIDLAGVVERVHPTMLIGTSTQPGAFTEAIVREMAAHIDRPAIMPLSNPTSKCEALPEDLVRWTDGRAPVATGSPFDAVPYQDRLVRIAQANNALVFPGLGLGVTVARASRITEPMLVAAADAVAELSDATVPGSAAPAPTSTTCARSRPRWRSRSRTPPNARASPAASSRTRSTRCTRRCGARTTPVEAL